MKTLRVILMSLAVVIGVGGAFATSLDYSTDDLFVSAKYNNGTHCNNTGNTDQSNCSTSNTGSACTVNVVNHPNAFQTGGTTCSAQLKQPI